MLFAKKTPNNLLDLLDERARLMPTRPAYKFAIDTGWGTMTWQQVANRVRSLAGYLVERGVMLGDRVALMSSTRIEWPLSCLAIWSAGATVVPIYPETGADDVAYILQNAGVSMVFVDTEEHLRVIRESGAIGLAIPAIVSDGGSGSTDVVFTEAHGSDAHIREVSERQQLVSGDTLATLLYTSGTTGKPKGVMLTHGNWLAEAMAIAETRIVDEHDVEYYWLPFAHSFGMALLVGHLAVGFLKFIDGNTQGIVEKLKEVKPTFMGGPPRTFEKIAAGIDQKMAAETSITRLLYQLAMRRSIARYQARQRAGKRFRPARVGISALVFGKLAEAFGGRLRFFISGGAPLSPGIAEKFDYWGVPILQGYGLTETCGASAVGRPDDHPIGSVGWPLPGTQVMTTDPIDGRVDGEILLRGPHVMVGYYGDAHASAEVLDLDGWFHTGDLGRIEKTADGRPVLYVTGRLKQACKLSTGKYVSPELLEVELTATGFIAHAVVIAEGQNFVSALVSLDPDNLRQWAELHGLQGSYEQLAASAAVGHEVRQLVDRLNARFNKWERIGQVRIIPEVFTVANGYLTPSNKVVRHRVFTAFGDIIEDIYR